MHNIRDQLDQLIAAHASEFNLTIQKVKSDLYALEHLARKRRDPSVYNGWVHNTFMRVNTGEFLFSDRIFDLDQQSPS